MNKRELEKAKEEANAIAKKIGVSVRIGEAWIEDGDMPVIVLAGREQERIAILADATPVAQMLFIILGAEIGAYQAAAASVMSIGAGVREEMLRVGAALPCIGAIVSSFGMGREGATIRGALSADMMEVIALCMENDGEVTQ